MALRPCLAERDCEAYNGCAFTARERAGLGPRRR
jgi:hypothetical protein